MNSFLWASLLLCVISGVAGLINLVLLRREHRMHRQWTELNKILLHLCVGAFLLQMWRPRLQHFLEIASDDEPAPEPRKRFWQRRTPKP